MLGLAIESEGENDMEFRAGQVTLDIFDPSSIGQPFAPSPAGMALRPRRRRCPCRARSEGRRFDGETIETGVCRQAWFRTRTGTP